MQRILAEVHGVAERQRVIPRRVRIVSVEAIAEKWLLPRLAFFMVDHPDIAIELETNHRGVSGDLSLRHNVESNDFWIERPRAASNSSPGMISRVEAQTPFVRGTAVAGVAQNPAPSGPTNLANV